MMRINLLPTERRDAVARLKRIRRWILGIGTGTAIVTAALSGGRAMWTDDRPSLRSNVSEQEEAQTDLIAQVSSLKKELARKREALHAANEIGDEPEWSILLALIADRMEEHIVLTNISLTPAEKQIASRPQVRADALPKGTQSSEGAVLLLAGIGTSAHQVSLFSVRLEEMNLFERVVIERSARSTTGQLGSIVFTIRCRLQERER